MTENPARLYGGQPDSFVVESAAVVPIVGKAENESWLDYKHPLFEQMSGRWKMTQDFYLGEPADLDCARNYLVRRFQGEPDQAYEERCKVADFTPHLGTLLDTLAGMLFGAEERTTRVWTKEDGAGGLGDPAVPGTTAYRLQCSADGKGTSWKTVWRQFTLDLLVFQYMWVLVDTVNGQHVVKLVSPMQVPNWLDSAAGPTEALMCESTDVRGSMMDKPGKQKSWIRWTTLGWERWQKDQDGTPVLVNPLTPYTYIDKSGNPALPIFRVELPMRRYIAWLLAKKANVLFNSESVRDFGLRISAFAKLLVNVVDTKQLAEIREMLRKGENVLPVDSQAKAMHAYIHPPSEPVQAASEVLDKKVEAYWMAGFKQYADAAAQKTATEIKQDVASGVGAFLQLLASAVDDAENGAFFRLEQAEYMDSPAKWGVAHTERPDDYSTVDLALVLDGMRKRYFGDTGTIPVGRSALIQMSKEAAQFDGLPVDQYEIESAVDAKLLGDLLANLQLLNVTPPLIKARLAMRLVAAMGLIDPKETIEMSDGEKQVLFDKLMVEATDLANVQDKQARMQAEMPAFNAGGGY